ncbi:MAG: MFS transporter [Thermoplasmataceae archaeon]
MNITGARSSLLLTENRQFWAITFASSIRSLAFGASWPFMAVYFNRGLGFPLYYVGIIFTLLAAVSMLFSLVGGILSDITGRKITLIVGSSFGSVIFALLAYLTYGAFNPLITALAFILSSISGSLVFPASSAMVSDLTSAKDRSMAYSIYRRFLISR